MIVLKTGVIIDKLLMSVNVFSDKNDGQVSGTYGAVLDPLR